MIKIRRSEDRGQASHTWLDSKHTFSFGRYYDAAQMGFRALRVINEDKVAPGQGFGTHPHDNAEIISYVLSGQLAHKDSLGNGSTIEAGEMQRITAGTGITHSEFNPSSSNETHFYQIWLQPKERDATPSYEQKSFRDAIKENELTLVVSPEGEGESLGINQDAQIYLGKLSSGGEVTYELDQERYAWLQMLRGSVELNGEEVREGDGVAISELNSLSIKGLEAEGASVAELLLFDLP